MRVLVADDNRDWADTLALLLTNHGYEVRATYDGREAPEVRPVTIAMTGWPREGGSSTPRSPASTTTSARGPAPRRSSTCCAASRGCGRAPGPCCRRSTCRR